MALPAAVKQEEDERGERQEGDTKSKADAESPSKAIRGSGGMQSYDLPPPQDELEEKLVVAKGAKCTAFDARDQRWYKSAIVELKGKQAKIHYDGWPTRYDAWVDIDLLKPPAKKRAVLQLPKPATLRCTATSTTSVSLEVTMPRDSAKVHEFRVELDGHEDPVKVKVFQFDAAAYTYSFEYKGLQPETEYGIAVKALARNCLPSDLSDALRIATDSPEDEGDMIEGGAGRSAKAMADLKSKQQAALLSGKRERVDLSEAELKLRADKIKTKYHDYHCDLCLGWDGKLICCDGVCKRSYHPECVVSRWVLFGGDAREQLRQMGMGQDEGRWVPLRFGAGESVRDTSMRRR